MMPKIDEVEKIGWNFAVDNETGEVYQVSSSLNEKGQELPDPIPMAPPVGFTNRHESIVDMVRRFVRDEYVNQQVDAAGFETFEEADDFDVEDDPPDPMTPYEMVFEPPAPKVAAAPSKTSSEVKGGAGGGEPSPKGEAPLPPDPKDTSGLVDPDTQ